MTGAAPNAEDLEALRDQGLTRQQIAEHYGVSLARVKRWIKQFDLPMKVKREEPVASPEPVTNPDGGKSFDEGLSLMDRCKNVLGRRMSEDHRGYLLDGRPCSSMQIRRAAGL